MKILLAVVALSTVIACGKKVEAIQATPSTVVVEPAKVEAVKEEVQPMPVVTSEVVDAGTVVVPAEPASPVK